MIFKSNLKNLLVVCAALFLMCDDLVAQSQKSGEDDLRTKDMWEVFTKKRPQDHKVNQIQPHTPINTGGKTASSRTSRNTRKPETATSASEPQPDYRKIGDSLPATGQEVGITVWRLRESRRSDPTEVKQKSLVQKKTDNRYSVQGKQEIELTPERVSPNAPLKEGERVQLSVEVPQKGYLYIINRERYSDGTFGEPYLIFPTKRINNGFNEVAPGRVVYIPETDNQEPFFTLERSSSKHIGEELIFVVTPTPIAELSQYEDRDVVPEKQFKELQKWAAQTGSIELADGKGKAQTVEEAEAAKESLKDGTKSLKHNSPLPQTIYRVARKEGEPMMMSLTLKIAQ